MTKILRILDVSTVASTTTASNIGSGDISIYAGTVGSDLRFKTLTGSGAATVTQTTNTVTIGINASFGGEVNTASNLGSGIGIFGQKIASDLQFKSLSSSTNNIIITYDASRIFIDVSNYISKTNVNASLGLYVPYIGATQDLSLGTKSIRSVESVQFNKTPITAFSDGQLYYDSNYKTLAVNLDNNITLQVGQENHVICYNNTGVTLLNGKAVYISGTNGIYPTINYAIASVDTSSHIIGITTQDISTGNIGYVTNMGVVHDVSTQIWPAGTLLYLSDTSAGELTSTPPISPNRTTELGHVIVSSATTGSILVDIQEGQSLTSLTDVTITSPSVDDHLVFNGVEWINAPGGTVSAGPLVTYYLDSSFAASAVSFDLSTSLPLYAMNRFTKLKTPSTTIDVSIRNGATPTVAYPIRLLGAYSGGTLTSTIINAGEWTFNTYAAQIDGGLTGTTEIVTTIYRSFLDPCSGIITMSGTGEYRNVHAYGSSPFLSSDADPSLVMGSWIVTQHGHYPITNYSGPSDVSIQILDGYVNDTSILLRLNRSLFNVTTGDLTSASIILYKISSIQPEFALDSSDSIIARYFGRTNATGEWKTVQMSYNGTTNYTNFSTPLALKHNDLAGLQGGTSTQRYHLTFPELVVVQNTSGINTGNQDLTPYVTNASANVIVSNINSSLGLYVQKAGDTMTGALVVNASLNINNKVFVNNIQTLNTPNQTLYPGTIFIGTGGTDISNGYNGGIENTYIGIGAGHDTTVAKSNTAVGFNALAKATSGWANTAVGRNALSTGVGTGDLSIGGTGIEFYANTAVGEGAMTNATTGSYNTAVGTNALLNLTTGITNNAFGVHAGNNVTTGNANVFMGNDAGRNVSDGSFMIAIGYNSLYNNISGSGTIAIGQTAGFTDKAPDGNIYIGSAAGYYQNTGTRNTIIGTESAYGVSSYRGWYASLLGWRSGYKLAQDNEGNVGIGYQSLYNITTGTYNTFLGSNTGNNASQKVDALRSIAIGQSSYTTKDDQAVFGAPSILETLLRGKVGIGTTDPSYNLDVSGNIHLTKELYSDGSVSTKAGYNIDQVAPPPTLDGSQGIAGNVPPGTHLYTTSYTTAIGETQVQTVYKSITNDASSVINLVIPVSPDSRVTGRKIYRAITGGTADNDRLLAIIPNNTSTNFVDNVSDGGLTGGYASGNFRANTTNNQITINGTRALFIDNNLVTLGRRTGQSITTGGRNTFIGDDAGWQTTTGSSNVFVGQQAGNSNLVGTANVYLGWSAGYFGNGGSNIAIGLDTLFYNAAGTQNVVLGTYAGFGVNGKNAGNNVMIGNEAGFYIKSNDNTFIGYRAGYNSSDGANVFIGNQAGFQETGGNKLYIANSQTSIPLIYGDFANNILSTTGKFGVGVKNPSVNLDVSGNFHITGGGIFDASIRMSNQIIHDVATPIDGSDAVNKFYVDSSFGLKVWTVDSSIVSLINPGQDVQLSSIQMQENGGVMTLVDMSVTNDPSGTEESYSFNMDGSAVLKIAGIADGSTGVSQKYIAAVVNYFYMGDPSTDNSWRWSIDGSSNLKFEKRVTGVWTFSGKFSV